MKLNLPSVTLLAVDTTSKSYLAERAILKCLEQADFGDVKLLTDNLSLKHSVKIEPIVGLESYSNFCIRELAKYVTTSHVLLVQSDGYILNSGSWTDEFLKYDYVGAPWLPSGTVGNGGFSLRSKKLLNLLFSNPFPNLSPHPEDSYICLRIRPYLEKEGIRFAPRKLAERFAFEGRSWNNGIEWQGVPTKWNGQFGFHSWLTPLPKELDKPKIFHHSGDWGDVIYSLPTMKALGGGVLFLSSANQYPYPRLPREAVTAAWSSNITPLLEAQDYIWKASFTHGLPYSVDYDLNKFRLSWKDKAASDFDCLWKLHLKAFGVNYPEDKPWLQPEKVTTVPGHPIVVNRTARYRNDHFPWLRLIQKYGDQMVFVGNEDEAMKFNAMSKAVRKNVPWIPTANLSDLAGVIAGAKAFIGNQSLPMAIALGLGKNVIQECWQANLNCLFNRKNCIYFGVTTIDPELDIPSEWLTVK